MIDFVRCFSSVEIDVNWDDEVKPSLRNRYNNLNQARISIKMQKTADIHPPKTGISVHFSD